MSFGLDAETLETLTFERSKVWANLLQSYENVPSEDEIDVKTFDEIFAEHDDGDEEESMHEYEEAEEDVVEDDINNTTQCMTQAELTQMVNSGSNKEILEQTMPIVEEHIRKWKEAGLDRILNTFDACKIEEHVGGWMRRNNSCYGNDKTLSSPISSGSKAYYKRYHQGVDLDDSDEETAHYIRNSCKRSTSKCKSPRTSIKMYRTLPLKRTELRSKYACQLSEEQQHRHHMQTLLQRRKEQHRRQRERELIFHTSPRHYSCSMVHKLRKRRDVPRLLPASSSSSSEDELQQHSRCECGSCTTTSAFSKSAAHPYYADYRRKCHSHSLRDYHHHREPRFELETRSFSSNVYYKRSLRHQLKRQHAFEQDRRPHLIENECGCCNNERLCSKVVHLANSSTEDWVVENKSSPDALPFETPKTSLPSATRPKSSLKMSATRGKVSTKTKCRAAAEDLEFELLKPTFSGNSKASNKTKSRADDELLFEPPKQHIPKAAAKAKLRAVEEMEFEQQKPTCSNIKAQTKAAITSSQAEAVPSTPKSAMESKAPKSAKLEELPANVISKDNATSVASPPKATRKPKVRSSAKKEKPDTPTNHNESTKTLTKKPIPNDKTAKASNKKKPSTQTSKKGTKTSRDVKNEETNHDDELSDLDEELKRALVLSRETYVKEREKLQQPVADEVKTDSPQLPEQSMFNNHSVACNSTALTNDTACSRALKPQKTSNPQYVVVSEACIDLCSPESSRTITEADNDCTMVTSTTTSCEAVAGDVAAASERPQLKISKKGVLLYEPQKSAGNSQSQSINSNNNSTANFTISEQILSPIIGKRKARRFFKYYTGNCSFDSRYYVYYCPPSKLLAALSSDSKSLDLDSSSSSDCEDDLEIIASLGVIHTEIGDD